MISKEINQYIDDHLPEEDQLLKELSRETHLKVLSPRMLSGHYQGRLLRMISEMVNPEYILEIGTYTGYSAICLAGGLQKNGQLHTIEINPELIDFAAQYFVKAGLSSVIKQHTGSAKQIIPSLPFKWDLVFIDADKENYLAYFKQVIGKVKTGGFILADNVLWDGKVIDPGTSPDKETKGIIEFNEYVKNNPRVEQIILPVRDGIMIIRKK